MILLHVGQLRLLIASSSPWWTLLSSIYLIIKALVASSKPFLTEHNLYITQYTVTLCNLLLCILWNLWFFYLSFKFKTTNVQTLCKFQFIMFYYDLEFFQKEQNCIHSINTHVSEGLRRLFFTFFTFYFQAVGVSFSSHHRSFQMSNVYYD